MALHLKASRARINRHWHVLCSEIGERYAGTRGEQDAADYIEGQMRRLGLAGTHQQPFEFPNWSYSQCALRVGKRRPTRRIEARPNAYSSATPDRGVSGPLINLQGGHKWDLAQPMKGKIGVLVGSLLLGDPDVRNQLVRSGIKALLAVDARIPFEWITSNGNCPAWMNGYHVPTVGIAYMDAIRLLKQMPARAHLKVKARSFPAMSQNVIGEIPGSRHPDQVIVVSAHHDAVWGNVGADDNASGVVFLLEMARLFARRRPKRTIRFISYGVEERLSVGAYLYAQSLTPAERRRIVFGINADSIATTIGSDMVGVTGTPQLARFVERIWNARRHAVHIERMVTPYSDHFPLNAIGVPTVWMTRPSIGTGSYWQLHSVHDNLENVSAAPLSRTIETNAILLDQVANATRLPFPRRLSPEVAREARRLHKSEYGHPWSPDSFDYDR
ncbi:MAG: hypothetical protein CMJ18_25710 [Phycisphaeraceae bacterium]|nr:hypothetical protein [Phycisphaeraceae bacterium]